VSRRHGASRSATYATWVSLKQRCLNPNRADYPNYGGRGITVCERWQQSFVAFLSDMGHKPAGMSIDRIDNDRGYEPGNCRWVTKTRQNRNRRGVTLDDAKVAEIRACLSSGSSQKEMASRFGVTKGTINRVAKGLDWLPEDGTRIARIRSPRYKLDGISVMQVRWLRTDGGHRVADIAAAFGISASRVYAVVRVPHAAAEVRK
jgi:DNA-binding XRE family transcriptional regulator